MNYRFRRSAVENLKGLAGWVFSAAIFTCILLYCFNIFGAESQKPIGPQLQEVSVNVSAGRYQGSGTIFLSWIADENQEGDPSVKSSWLLPVDGEAIRGRPAAFILTAHHVIEALREVREVIDSGGTTKKTIRYGDTQVIQEQVEYGRTIGEIKYDAKVINVDARRDIALLRVRKGDFAAIGANFYLGTEIPVAGTEIYHCGAPGGKDLGGTSTLTGGIVSRIGVRIPDFGGGSEHGIFDQTDTAALGGSSGGMVAFRSNGQWIGMITLGLRSGGDNFHWFVPARSVRAWAEEVNVMWLFDTSLPRPTEEDIKAIVLENVSPGYAGKTPTLAP